MNHYVSGNPILHNDGVIRYLKMTYSINTLEYVTYYWTETEPHETIQ